MKHSEKTNKQLEAEISQLRRRIVELEAAAERAQTENSPPEKNVLHQIILENISDPVFVTDDEGNLTFVSANVANVLGYSVQDVQAMGHISALVGDDLFDLDVLDRLDEISNIEGVITDKAGTKRNFLITVKRVSLDQGALLYTCREITRRQSNPDFRRHRGEDVLKALHLLKRIANTAPYLLYVFVLAQEKNTYVNTYTERFFGLSLEALQQRGQDFFAEILHPDDLDKLAEFKVQWDKAEDHQVFEKEYRMRNAAGEYRWLHSYETILSRDGDRKPTQILGTAVDVTAQKEMELALRNSETKTRAILDAIPDLMFLITRDGQIVDFRANDVADLILDSDQVIGSYLSEAMPPEVCDVILTNIAKTLETGQVQIFEFELPVKRGFQVFEARLAVSGDERVLAIVRNVTQRRRAEERLLQYKQIFSMTPDAIFLVDREYIYRLVNTSYLRKTKKNYSEVVGHSVAELMGETVFREVIKPKFDRCLAGETIQYQAWFTYAAEGRRFMDVTYTPYQDKNNAIDGVLVSVRDITDARVAEEKLSRLSQVVEQSPSCIVITDIKGDIEYVNPKFTELTGYAFEEVRGKNPNILKSGKTPPHVYEELWTSVLAGETYRCEFHNQKKNGEFFWEDAIISPIRNEQGEIECILAIKEDVTERKRIEARLRRTQRLETIGTMAGGIAHDFNNILTPILGYAELASYHLPADSPTLAYLNEISGAAIRAKELVQQILTFSRQTEHERTPTKLQPLIAEVLKLLRPSLPATIEIRQNIAPSCGPVLADPAQIHQVLMNLCTNAYHAMEDAGGILTLELTQITADDIDVIAKSELKDKTYARLVVKDTGHGIDSITLERIFEPFFTTKSVGKGTGLGLSVVHGIIKGFDGTILVKSSKGEGALFEIYLPIFEGGSESISENRLEHSLVGGAERILLVDDEMSIVGLLQKALSKLGYEVVGTSNSVEAMHLCKRDNRFDLLITDLTMPHKTGLQLSKEIAGLFPALPVILISGAGDVDALPSETLRETNIRTVIKKPIRLDELAKAVRWALG